MTETTTTTIPEYIKEPSKKALSGISNWVDSSGNYVYGTKPGESLFTGMNGLQKEAIGNIDWLGDQDIGQMFGHDQANNWWGEYANAGPETVSTNGIFDDNGPAGAFSDYMNPYISGVLTPQLRELQEQQLRNQNAIGRQATMSGAFGDARHGIMEGQNYEMGNQAMSDATGRAYSDAFDRATGLRTADINRFLTKDLANASARRNATERLGTAATGILATGDNWFNKFSDINDSLYNAGSKAYTFEEAKRKAQQDFQERLINKPYDDYSKLITAANGMPKESTQSTSSDTGWLQLLGALGGAIL